MTKVKVSDDFDASIDQVWALIKDFGNLSAWAPDAKITKLEGEGIGAIRHLDTAIGRFKERCEAHDDGNYSFSYALLESSMPDLQFLGFIPFKGDIIEADLEGRPPFEKDREGLEAVKAMIEKLEA